MRTNSHVRSQGLWRTTRSILMFAKTWVKKITMILSSHSVSGAQVKCSLGDTSPTQTRLECLGCLYVALGHAQHWSKFSGHVDVSLQLYVHGTTKRHGPMEVLEVTRLSVMDMFGPCSHRVKLPANVSHVKPGPFQEHPITFRVACKRAPQQSTSDGLHLRVRRT